MLKYAQNITVPTKNIRNKSHYAMMHYQRKIGHKIQLLKKQKVAVNRSRNRRRSVLSLSRENANNSVIGSKTVLDVNQWRNWLFLQKENKQNKQENKINIKRSQQNSREQQRKKKYLINRLFLFPLDELHPEYRNTRSNSLPNFVIRNQEKSYSNKIYQKPKVLRQLPRISLKGQQDEPIAFYQKKSRNHKVNLFSGKEQIRIRKLLKL